MAASENATVAVTFKQPPDVVFRYLADPRNRPSWQSSLRSVTMLDDGAPRVGMRWVDVTKVGLKPRMEITAMTPYRVWAESGTWRGVTADLELRFTATTTGTRVEAVVSMRAEGMWRIATTAVSKLTPAALRQDLERASKRLGSRA